MSMVKHSKWDAMMGDAHFNAASKSGVLAYASADYFPVSDLIRKRGRGSRVCDPDSLNWSLRNHGACKRDVHSPQAETSKRNGINCCASGGRFPIVKERHII